MGKSAPAAPPTPDYTGAAQAQGQANKETAIAQGYINNPNVYGPTGSQVVTFGANNQPTITQSLTPTAQATFEAQQRVQKALSNLGEQGIGTAQGVLGKAFQPTVGALQTQLDTSNLAQMPVNAGTTGQEAILSRLEPTLTRRSNQLEQTLANQGLTLGGEAYRNAKLDESRAQNDLLTQAALQGIGLDTSARTLGFNEAQAKLAAENQAKLSAFQQDITKRQYPINEIAALMSGSQLTTPQFQSFAGSQIAPAPITASQMANNQNMMDLYGIQSANANAGNAGLYNVLGTVGGLGAKKLFGLG
jgi:hypothetical protein